MTDPTAASPSPSEPRAPAGRKGEIIATVVTVVTLIVIFFGVFPQFADYRDAWDSVEGMSTGALGLLILATLGNVLVYVFPYQAALPGISFGPAFVVRQTSFAISNAVPAGGAFGLAAQYAMLSGYGFGPAPATAAIGVTSVWNLLVTLGLPVLAVLGLAVTGSIEQWAVAAAVIGLVVMIGLVALLVVIFRSEPLTVRVGSLVDRLVAWVGSLFRQEWDVGGVKALSDFRATTASVVAARAMLITVTNIAQQVAQFSVLLIALRGIQGDVPTSVTVIEAFAAFSLGRLGSFVPLTPGGVGTVDALMTSILVGFGVSNADAVAATLVWRGATYFPQVFVGIGTFLYWRGRKARIIHERVV